MHQLFQSFKSKLQIFFFAMCLGLVFIQTSGLEAAGWGKTEETTEYEDVTWDDVYFDLNGLHMTASIPNYGGTMLENGIILMAGRTEDDDTYIILTTLNGNFEPPQTLKQFAKDIKETYPGSQVVTVDAKKLGAKYAVDVTVKDKDGNKNFGRVLSTNDRLIPMFTNDTNKKRQAKFFNSIRIL